MALESDVFNSSIGAPYRFDYPQLTKEQETEILASLFEQLLIFDKITICTGRLNFALYFLIRHLGLKTVERLISSGYVRFMIWTPMIFTSTGRQLPDRTIDESTIYGQPPLVSGTLSDSDRDPEQNIHTALANLKFDKHQTKAFTKKTIKSYIVPEGMEFSSGSAKLVIDAYKNNNLAALGLPYEREPEQLYIPERTMLLHLGHKVIETALLSKFNLKSYENYESYEICKQNLSNIGKAYNISANTGVLFKLESLPNLKDLFITERMDFDSVFKIRHLSNAKYYRKWINNVGENSNAEEITKEYYNELRNDKKFFASKEGRFLKNLMYFSFNTALTTALTGVNPVIAAGAAYPLGLLEDFWLDNILKGKKPSMFIDEIKTHLMIERGE